MTGRTVAIANIGLTFLVFTFRAFRIWRGPCNRPSGDLSTSEASCAFYVRSAYRFRGLSERLREEGWRNSEIEPLTLADTALLVVGAKDSGEYAAVLLLPEGPCGVTMPPSTRSGGPGVPADLVDHEELSEIAWCDQAQLSARVPAGIFGRVQEYLDRALTKAPG